MFYEGLFKELFDDFDIKELENEEVNDDKSYYHYVSDKYENGEQVSHREKIVKDGKVLKDVNNTKQIEDKGNENSSPKYDKIKELEKEIFDKDMQIKKLNKKIDDLTFKNNELNDKLHQIKFALSI